MFTAALFTIGRTWKQPKYPSTDEWIKKMWHIYTMEYYSAIKINEVELFVVRWMDLESVMQRKGTKNLGQDGNKGTDLVKNGLEDMGRGRGSCDKVREWHGHIYLSLIHISEPTRPY